MKARCRRFVLSLALAALFAAIAQSQESRATLGGTVTDPSGSVIPATAVSLINSQTGVAFKTKTNEAGQYRFLFLNPGAYRLSVQSPGFRTFVRENIQLQMNLAPVIDVALTGVVAGTSPASTSGRNNRMNADAWQPGFAMRLDARIFWR